MSLRSEAKGNRERKEEGERRQGGSRGRAGLPRDLRGSGKKEIERRRQAERQARGASDSLIPHPKKKKLTSCRRRCQRRGRGARGRRSRLLKLLLMLLLPGRRAQRGGLKGVGRSSSGRRGDDAAPSGQRAPHQSCCPSAAAGARPRGRGSRRPVRVPPRRRPHAVLERRRDRAPLGERRQRGRAVARRVRVADDDAPPVRELPAAALRGLFPLLRRR